MFRQLTKSEPLQHFKHAKNSWNLSFRKREWLKLLTNRLSKVPWALRDQSTIILKEWIYQCECVMAQRLRRGQQMFCLYSRLWGERALKNFIQDIQRKATLRGRNILLSAVGIASFDWKKDRIRDEEILKHENDIQYIHLLKSKTICNKAKEEKQHTDGQCPCNTRFKACEMKIYDTWMVFIEQDDLIVWRRLHKTGVFEYKVFGTYNDVSAEDFLSVQIDTVYRKVWDSSAVELEIVESDPSPDSNSDIIYWETQWPKFFANRDYVFNRRYLVDLKSKTLYLMNRSTTHPSIGKKAGKFRIEDYSSIMVIKPHKDFKDAGIEFSLTYYDNPGISLPASVTTWVAMKAMPEFLTNLRAASKKYKAYCREPGRKCYTDLLKAAERVQKPVRTTRLDYTGGDDIFDDEDIITDNTIAEPQFELRRFRRRREPSPVEQQIPTRHDSISNESLDPIKPPQYNNYWKYLHPMYYFS